MLSPFGEFDQFLLVYLHSDRHPRTSPFCREVLSDASVIRFIEETFVIWGGSISSQEGAGAQHALNLSTFPFLAVVASRRDRPYGRALAVREGSMAADDVKAFLQSVLERHGVSLVTARLEQEERDNVRRLREEQDMEYQRSLAADRERERKRAEEEAKKEEEAREAREKEEAAERLERDREARRARKREALASSEPERGPEVASIILRLPDGTRATRRFHFFDTLESVFDWTDTLGAEISLVSLASTYPRRVFNYPEDNHVTLAQAELTPSASLLLEQRESTETSQM